MLKSMTGFGRYEVVSEERKVIVEMKSVNHRYCDISIRLPKKLNFFEARIRTLLKQYIGRGKIDVFISYEDYTENKACVKYNQDIAKEYMQKLEEMAGTFQRPNDITISSLSRYPDVFTLEEQSTDEEHLWNILKEAVEEAADKFVSARVQEGEHLKLDVYEKLENICFNIDFIEVRAPKILSEYREKLTAKVRELLGDTKVDDNVLSTELVVYADKICVDEETVRLKSHIANMKATMEEGANVGRKLDFIAQEMNREANTILSKANDIEVSNRAIDLKTEIEKIREQIQNIE